MSNTLHLTLLAIAWMFYGFLHSLLASHACKTAFRHRFPDAFRFYRLGYNLLAVLLLLPPLWLLFAYQGEPLWRWPPLLRWAADFAALAAIAGFLWTTRSYDTGEFLGFRQVSENRPAVDEQQPMSLSVAHRFVRHPWYFFFFFLVWTREMNAALLLSALILTLYVLIGSRQEEKKLLACYGTQYRSYQAAVPGLIPRPWRYLSKRKADEILRMNDNKR
jgi:protein-S-isoprenylcysteine O-methyltransferase Ste14